ncbi:hypothetical protein MRX96_035965 [Rhipicephalus microplus]
MTHGPVRLPGLKTWRVNVMWFKHFICTTPRVGGSATGGVQILPCHASAVCLPSRSFPLDLGLQAWYSMILPLKILNISPVEALQYRNRSKQRGLPKSVFAPGDPPSTHPRSTSTYRRSTGIPGCHPLDTASCESLVL